MIAQRNINQNAMEINEKGTMQAILAALSQKPMAHTPRWDCEVCGMIHLGSMPLACDSCGSKLLVCQSHIHREMNSHW